MQFLTWIFTAIALYGTYLNCIKDVRGFYWWIVSNTAFAVINFLICQYALTFLFFYIFDAGYQRSE